MRVKSFCIEETPGIWEAFDRMYQIIAGWGQFWSVVFNVATVASADTTHDLRIYGAIGPDESSVYNGGKALTIAKWMPRLW